LIIKGEGGIKNLFPSWGEKKIGFRKKQQKGGEGYYHATWGVTLKDEEKN